MFKRVLIANRGEIAVRVIRACKDLGIETVAVYSTADSESLHVKMANQAICIGPPPIAQSYLNMTGIISAAEVSGADAIHPGYGFLAESPEFAEVCESSDIKFIGPSSSVIADMGNKSAARKLMSEHGVAIIPGSKGIINDEKEALSVISEMGLKYPVIIKASAGGGGRGMRIVQREKELIEAIRTAKAEANNAFGSDEIYIEKYIGEPRHVEVQIMADNYGNVFHFGERDCSIQRRHQKLIEEAPCPVLSEAQREKVGTMAVECAKAVNYQGAGTIEFLLDADGNFYFMEMNTRIQVEHPISEEVTGTDLVKMQISVAAGESLENLPKPTINGHAIEFRINAENWENNFMPTPGTIELYNPAGGPGVRVDSHIYSGYTVPPFYDSLLAKLIIWGKDRNEALARAERALSEFVVVGVHTTIPFHQKIIKNAFFISGDYYTNFIARRVLEE